ncbi:hypothetical protein BDZ97DRAFT_1847279 [Flammula alnicola]|nr:hypothetical protein BDZ97DRAFT_1847279 [Flammula alnicola]
MSKHFVLLPSRNHHQQMTIAETGISDMPTKILEMILDFLHNDHAALYSASLVSREWVSTPRHRLFNRTIIKEFRIPYRGTIQENVHSFLALALSEHCTILPVIQCIVLNVTTPELIRDVVKVLALSKVLSQIVFMDLSKSSSISWIAHVLPNIHDFTFNTWSTFGDDACRLVTSFPSLHTLAVYTNADTTITLLPVVSSSPFRNLRTLRLKLLGSEELFDWLKNLDGSHSILETLDLRIFRSCHRGWGSVNALNSFLKRNSGTLKHLSLGIDYNPGLKDDSLNEGSRIDLSPLVNLRSLFFRTHDMSAVCDSLTSLSSSPALEALTVHALPWEPDIYNRIKQCDCVLSGLLTRFASIIEGKQFIGTKILDLNVLESLQLDVVAEPLTKWKQRGALKLSYAYADDDDQLNTLDSIQHLIFKRKS